MNRNRRTFMQAVLGLSGATLFSGGSFAAGAAKPKKLLTVFVSGGWDTTYALDAKQGASGVDSPQGDLENVGQLVYLADPSRPNARSFFEQHGALTTVVNGIQVQSINHPDCAKRMLTGTASDTSPDFSTIVAHELGSSKSAPLLALGPTAFTGNLGSIAVRTGTVTQLKTLMDPDAAFPGADLLPTQRFRPDAAEAKAIDSYVKKRANALFGGSAANGKNQARVQDFLASRERGEAFKKFSDAFADELEFSLDINVQIDIAVRALTEGLSQSVHLETPFGWDTHTENELQGPLQEELFLSLTTLVEKLQVTPGTEAGSKLIDETVVVVVSEMGRTPKLNIDGGKDHWPVTSAIVLGGGLKGARTLGGTDDTLQSRKVDFATGQPSEAGKTVQYGNFAAAVLEAVGVDSKPYFPNAEAFHALNA